VRDGDEHRCRQPDTQPPFISLSNTAGDTQDIAGGLRFSVSALDNLGLKHVNLTFSGGLIVTLDTTFTYDGGDSIAVRDTINFRSFGLVRRNYHDRRPARATANTATSERDRAPPADYEEPIFLITPGLNGDHVDRIPFSRWRQRAGRGQYQPHPPVSLPCSPRKCEERVFREVAVWRCRRVVAAVRS